MGWLTDALIRFTLWVLDRGERNKLPDRVYEQNR